MSEGSGDCPGAPRVHERLDEACLDRGASTIRGKMAAMRRGVLRTWIGFLLLSLLALGALGACAIPFGGGGEPSGEEPSSTTTRERNRLYLQEQEQTERLRERFEGGPPSDR